MPSIITISRLTLTEKKNNYRSVGLESLSSRFMTDVGAAFKEVGRMTETG